MNMNKPKKGIPRLWKEEPLCTNESNIKMLAQGAEAKVYEVYYVQCNSQKLPEEETTQENEMPSSTSEVSDNHSISSTNYLPIPSVYIVKERIKKQYRHPTLDAKLIKERMRQEARIMHRCRSYGILTPLVYMINDLEGKMYMERIDGPTVKEYFKSCYDESSHSYNEKAIRIAQLLGKLIASFHDHEIVHGDPTTSNFIVKSSQLHNDTRNMFSTDQGDKDSSLSPGDNNIVNSEEVEIFVIDFGLGSSNASEEDKAVDLYVLERAIISTHPNSELLVSNIMDRYSKASQPKKCLAVYKRLEDVKRRGRKRDMTG